MDDQYLSAIKPVCKLPLLYFWAVRDRIKDGLKLVPKGAIMNSGIFLILAGGLLVIIAAVVVISAVTSVISGVIAAEEDDE